MSSGHQVGQSIPGASPKIYVEKVLRGHHQRELNNSMMEQHYNNTAQCCCCCSKRLDQLVVVIRSLLSSEQPDRCCGRRCGRRMATGEHLGNQNCLECESDINSRERMFGCWVSVERRYACALCNALLGTPRVRTHTSTDRPTCVRYYMTWYTAQYDERVHLEKVEVMSAAMDLAVVVVMVHSGDDMSGRTTLL
ncbi:hypothetical protein CBL_10918 [Carabus blaptoides fortunei]